MKRNLIETVLAAVVIIVAASFVIFVMNLTDRASNGSYDIKANFIQTPGLMEGAKVQIAGVQVGYVSRIAVNPATFDVEVRMEIDEQVGVPADSSAALSEDGALGGTIVQLRRGAAATMIESGGFVTKTVSPVNLIDQIGRFLYGSDL